MAARYTEKLIKDGFRNLIRNSTYQGLCRSSDIETCTLKSKHPSLPLNPVPQTSCILWFKQLVRKVGLKIINIS